MSGLDLWGAVIPAWLGGVGGLAAAVVGTIALIKSLKTQGGVETLKGAANAGGNAEPLSAARNATGETDLPTSAQSPVSWTAWHKTRSQYQLRNDSTHNGAVARLKGLRDVTPGGDDAASYHGPLPVELAANESIPFTIEKSLVSPSVTAIELTWEDSDSTERKRTLYI